MTITCLRNPLVLEVNTIKKKDFTLEKSTQETNKIIAL